MRESRAPCALLAVAVLSAARAAFAPCAAGEPPGDLDAARRAYLSGSYAEAEKSLRALSEAGDGDSRETLARLLVETGRAAEAGAVAAGLLAEGAPPSRALTLAGEIELLRGKTREAEDLFVKALAAQPDARRPRVFLKRIYDLTARPQDSEKIVDYFWNFNNATLVPAKDGGDARDYLYVALAVRDADAEATKVAFRHLRRAYARDPDLHEAYVAAGDLALDVHDWARAKREFDALLKRNPRHPEGHLGLARVYLAASENTKAEAEAKAVLEVSPASAGAHMVLAELHLLDDRMEEAKREIDAALRANPALPEALALEASWRFASGDHAGFEAVAKKARALYPRFVGVHAGAASVLERRRQFPEALAQYRKAVELDPEGWEGRYGVGMTLVRAGEEREGYAALEKAFEKNPFNVWAYNTLTALDRDFKEGALARRDTEHFAIKVTRTEDAVMGEHLEEVLEAIWAEETKRFSFSPAGPKECGGKILFEMFADHGDFSARTTGMPNLGALGATLGQIVTMPSPSWGAGVGKPFRWTAVARHEFCHVVTLQLTEYRIPRWFTEGVSLTIEEDPQVSADGLLARAAGEGEIPPLSRLNSLFTRPDTPADVALGYALAALVVDYLVKNHGFEAVTRACELYRAGRQPDAVIPAVSGLSAEELDRRVRRHVDEYLARVRAWAPPGRKEMERLKSRLAADPADAAARARYAEGLLAQGRFDLAAQEAEKAPGSARASVVRGLVLKVRDRNDAAALARFEAAAAADPEDFLAQLYLGLARWRAGSLAEAARALERAHEMNPRFTDPIPVYGARSLARVLLEALEKLGERERLLAAAVRAATTDLNDFESARLAGKMLFDAGRTAAAARWLDAAISANPFDAASQVAFARGEEALAREETGPAAKKTHLGRASRAYRAAVAIEQANREALSGLARTLIALNRGEEARAAIEALRRVDPAAASGIEKEIR